MAVNYSAISNVGWPVGASSQVFSGVSSTGTYTYTGSLAAGNYILVTSAPGSSGSYNPTVSAIASVNATSYQNNTSGGAIYMKFASTETSLKVYSSLAFKAASYAPTYYWNSQYFTTVSGTPYVSTDLITWTAKTNPWGAVTNVVYNYGGGLYHSVNRTSSTGASNIYSSTDLTTWTSRSVPGTYSGGWLNGIAYGNSRWVLDGQNSSNTQESTTPSTDGITFTTAYSITGFTSLSASLIAFGSTKFVVSSPSAVYSSTDGVTWGNRLALGYAPSTVANGKIFMTSQSGGSWYTSTDAVTFTQITSAGTPTQSPTVGYALGAYYVSWATNGGTYTSTDGLTWSGVNIGSLNSISNASNGNTLIGIPYNIPGTTIGLPQPTQISLFAANNLTTLN